MSRRQRGHARAPLEEKVQPAACETSESDGPRDPTAVTEPSRRRGPPAGRSRERYATEINLVHKLRLVAQILCPGEVRHFIRKGWKLKFGSELREDRLTYLLYHPSHARERARSRARALASPEMHQVLTGDSLVNAVRLQRRAEALLDDLIRDPSLRKTGKARPRHIRIADTDITVPVHFEEIDSGSVITALGIILAMHQSIARQHALAAMTGQRWPPALSDPERFLACVR